MTADDRQRDDFHWAPRVARHKIRRLYDSDAKGMLDQELLDDVGYAIYVRCLDMIELATAIRGEVTCRSCGSTMLRHGWQQIDGVWYDPKSAVLDCPSCDWRVTWGDYFQSYSGKCMLPGSATEVIEGFAARWPQARSPVQKMRLIDWMIHEFHVNQGVDGRPVGENVISGSKAQVIELIEELAYGPRSAADPTVFQDWRGRLNDPIRRFRQSHSWAKTQWIARKLGIHTEARTQDQNAVVAEILRRAPDLGEG